MLDIYICEDNDAFRKHLVQVIARDIDFSEKNMQVVYDTACPYDLLEKLKGNSQTNIYFLDIDLGAAMDGIELAEKIRRFDALGYIVFVTADGHSYKRTFEYKLQALGYVEKNKSTAIDDAIVKLLNKIDTLAVKQNTPRKNSYSFRSAGRTIHLDKADIITIEVKDSNAKHLSLFTDYANYEYSGTLKAALDQLSDNSCQDFVRVHQSRILNLNYIKKINFDRSISLINGIKCKSSKRYLGSLKQALKAKKSHK